MTTLETNAAPAEASGEGVRTPEKAVRWAIPLSLLACVLLAFSTKSVSPRCFPIVTSSRRWASISTPPGWAF